MASRSYHLITTRTQNRLNIAIHMQYQFNRKISFSLLLNDDYEGGELQILKPPTGLIKDTKESRNTSNL